MYRADINPDHEPHKVLMARGEFFDTARDNRKVPFKIYYPAAVGLGALPVVIWSHGLGGSRDGAGFISRFLSSHGYVVVHVEHLGTDSSLWEGKPGHPWDVIRESKYSFDDVMNRYHDVPFVLDQLPSWAAENPEIGQHMDLSCIGMSGHSFGANTTQIMAGQSFGKADDLQRLFEPRFKAGILYSPVPSFNTESPRADIYGTISLPLFHMTGTDDTSPIEGFGYERRLEVYQHSGGPEQCLLVLNDGDHMVYNGSRGKLADNPKRPAHENIIKIAALAYWDVYLKQDAAARSWLFGGGFSSWINGEGSFTAP
ncbi:MAG: alpha/beta hydrolase family protein [Micavibrio sp.]